MLAGVSIAAVANITRNHVAMDMDEKDNRSRSGGGSGTCESVTVGDLGSDWVSPRNLMVCTRQLTKHVRTRVACASVRMQV